MSSFYQLQEVTLITLDKLPPTTYVLKLQSDATIKDVKQRFLDLMKTHKQECQLLSYGFLREIESLLSSSNLSQNTNDWDYIPTDVINLCRQFFDEYYNISINKNPDNYGVLTKNKDNSLIHLDDNRIFTHSGITKYDDMFLYQLYDEQRLKQVLKCQNIDKKYNFSKLVKVTHTIPDHYKYKSIGLPFMIRLPLRSLLNERKQSKNHYVETPDFVQCYQCWTSVSTTPNYWGAHICPNPDCMEPQNLERREYVLDMDKFNLFNIEIMVLESMRKFIKTDDEDIEPFEINIVTDNTSIPYDINIKVKWKNHEVFVKCYRDQDILSRSYQPFIHVKEMENNGDLQAIANMFDDSDDDLSSQN